MQGKMRMKGRNNLLIACWRQSQHKEHHPLTIHQDLPGGDHQGHQPSVPLAEDPGKRLEVATFDGMEPFDQGHVGFPAVRLVGRGEFDEREAHDFIPNPPKQAAGLLVAVLYGIGHQQEGYRGEGA